AHHLVHGVEGRLRQYEDRGLDSGVAQLDALFDQGDAEPRGPALESSAGDRYCTVPVAVGFDHGAHDTGPSEGGQTRGVVANGPEVDLGPHGPEGLRRGHGPFWTIAFRMSPRDTMPTSLPSLTTGRRDSLCSCSTVATCSRVSSSPHVGGLAVITPPTVEPTALRTSLSNLLAEDGSSKYAPRTEITVGT